MKTSVITPIYNNLELCQKTIESVLKHTEGDFEYLLIYNHPLDSRILPYLQSIQDGRVKVLDPGLNIGCHQAVNYGIQHATGDYYVKLDDDSAVETTGWDMKLIDAINTWNKENPHYPMAFIAPDSNVKQVTNTAPSIYRGISYDIVMSGVLGFSMVMIPRSTYELFGPLQSRFWADGEEKKENLYGGEELWAAQMAIKHRMCYGYCNDVKIEHADNELRNPLYPAWKWGVGFRGWATGDLTNFMDNNEVILMVCQDWLNTDNDWYRKTALMIMEKIKQTGKAY